MSRLSSRFEIRPGLRAAVLTVCALLVMGTAAAVSVTVTDHLSRMAVAESVRQTEAVVRGLVDPMFASGQLVSGGKGQRDAVNGQLQRLVGSGSILRIKVWAADGTVVYSDLAQLRGRKFDVEDDLTEALDGEVATEFSAGDAAENVFEHGLAAQFLSMYLPIHGASADQVIGAYEVYEDAAPIAAEIESTRTTVLLIVGAFAVILLAILFGAFSGASRLLARRNRLLRRSRSRFRSLIQNSADVHMIVDRAGSISYESPAVERVLGYSVGQRIGTSPFATVERTDRARAERALADVMRTPGGLTTAEVRMRHADGSWRRIEMVLKNLLDDDAVEGVVINYRDVTQSRALEDELRHQAFHDSLTGLANRALLLDRLQHAMSRKRSFGLPLAVMFVDIDDFKTVNDSLGHSEGDRLLIDVADRLRQILRDSDTVARMGGDEFAIVIEEAVDVDAPLNVCERILTCLQPPFQRGGHDVFVRASIGVSTWTTKEETAEDLLRNADIAMYTAKANGKNRVAVFEAGMRESPINRLGLKGDLELALARAELFIAYQPIVRLSDMRITGAEALLRWRHPKRGIVMPAEFVPLAEETGLIVPLGLWVLEMAARQCAEWNGSPSRGLHVNVNVSVRQLQQPDFVEHVRRVMKDNHLRRGQITLEFTESMLMSDTVRTLSTLAALKKAGVRLAIDDFGTGYSSLSYLRRFPIDELKIDRSFTSALGGDLSQLAVMRSIVRLGKTLRLDTVAEGVERADQLEVLRTLETSHGQGFLFAEPVSPGELVALVDGEIASAGRRSVA